jgi:hypothetical protein
MLKKISLLSFFFLLILAKQGFAQEIIDTPITNLILPPKIPKPVKPKVYVMITGRVLGVNLENVQGVIVTNICTDEKVSTDNHGIYHINVAKGDSVGFAVAKYSSVLKGIKSDKAETLNVIMIKRKADNLPPGHSRDDYNKAKTEDDDLYRILEKDAKVEGKWNY